MISLLLTIADGSECGGRCRVWRRCCYWWWAGQGYLLVTICRTWYIIYWTPYITARVSKNHFLHCISTQHSAALVPQTRSSLKPRQPSLKNRMALLDSITDGLRRILPDNSNKPSRSGGIGGGGHGIVEDDVSDFDFDSSRNSLRCLLHRTFYVTCTVQLS